MATVSVSRTYPAPPDRVYGMFADLRGAPGRIPSILRIEILAGSDGPLSVGTRWRETRLMFGREATEVMEVTEAVPGQRYRVEARSCGCHYVTEFLFRPRGGGTEVSMTFTGRPLTLGARLMSPMLYFMKGTLRRCLEEDLAALARALESESGATTGASGPVASQ